ANRVAKSMIYCLGISKARCGLPDAYDNTNKFFDMSLANEKAQPLDLHLLFGGAGCGKTTSLKQLALKVSDEGGRNVYFVEEYKDRLVDLIHELDIRNGVFQVSCRLKLNFMPPAFLLFSQG
ncbi:ATP-binding protein, partial [Pseudoalteromonas sp. MER144-MNA-CIBAN-0113]|uniref:ATP-binding protein n=1 Tax=Pseudoalteromonas sp. MER144-MNA-CIBAN-0113 TaxID=3140429 RepID=UPI00332134ED